MSYQVLARKWRPNNFSEMVGQEHVLQALINALDNDRLHHAYVFTGTRGVGKTTTAINLGTALDMTAFGKMRYTLLGEKNHWFPGFQVGDPDRQALLKSLENSPFPDKVVDSLLKAHDMLIEAE